MLQSLKFRFNYGLHINKAIIRPQPTFRSTPTERVSVIGSLELFKFDVINLKLNKSDFMRKRVIGRHPINKRSEVEIESASTYQREPSRSLKALLLRVADAVFLSLSQDLRSDLI